MTQENSLGGAGARHHQLRQLLRSVLPPESECAAYLPRLASYVDAQLAGEDYLSRYPDIAIHLDTCLACADSYARLYDLEIALAQEALPTPKVMPTPDLSFLSRPEAKPSPSLVDLLSAALTTTANTIRLQLTAELLAFLQPQQSAALTRSAVDDSRYSEVLYELHPEQYPETAIPIKLVVYRDAQRLEQCLLEVTVMPPGVSWPNLGGYTVTLQMGSDYLTATTDAWGVAPFLDLSIARLDDLALVVELTKV
jgi:hypothetical protein